MADTKCPHCHEAMVNGVCPKCKGGNWKSARELKANKPEPVPAPEQPVE